MSNYLLDVNVLLAWGWSDHADHERTAGWIGRALRSRATVLMTSSIPELGFIRVSVQRTSGHLAVEDAAAVLLGMLKSLGRRHRFVVDVSAPSNGLPDWCKSAGRTTDAHLLALAQAQGARLATLDSGIPDAFLISEGAAKG